MRGCISGRRLWCVSCMVCALCGRVPDRPESRSFQRRRLLQREGILLRRRSLVYVLRLGGQQHLGGSICTRLVVSLEFALVLFAP